MAEKKLEGAGLRGQVAGQTALSTVGKEGKGLTYRGYAIEELSEKASFEEVAYMLLYGNLPSQSELSKYCLLYTSPSPRDLAVSRMPSSA